jgi:dipeptidyl-peptidase III
MKVLHEAGDIFDVEFAENDGKEYFYINFEKEKIKSACFDALKPFLHKLHVLKSIGDYDTAKEWFDKYSEVDDHFLKIKRIVEANRLPRRLEIQPNVFLSPYGEVEYKDYDQSIEGIIRSYVERFPHVFYDQMYDEWNNNKELFRIQP